MFEEQSSSSQNSGRRLSNLSSSVCSDRLRLSKSDEIRTTFSTPSREGNTDTSDTIKESNEHIKKIQKHTREIRKQLTFSTKTYDRNQQRNSDASTCEQVPIHVLRETVIAEVHQINTNRTKAETSRSLESVVKYPDESGKQQEAKTTKNEEKALGLKAILQHPDRHLLAEATPCRSRYTEDEVVYLDQFVTVPQSADPLIHGYINDLYQNYEFGHGYESPPPPAPSDPHTKPLRFHLKDTYIGKRYLEPSRHITKNVTFEEDFLGRKCDTEIYGVGGFSYRLPREIHSPTEIKVYRDTAKNQDLSHPHDFSCTYCSDSVGLVQRHLEVSSQYLQSLKGRVVHHPRDYRDTSDNYQSEQRDYFFEVPQTNYRRLKNRSAKTFLELSPDFDEDYDQAELHQLPQEFFRRPVQERFLERYPPPVRSADFDRPRLSPNPPQKPKREQRPPPSASRRPELPGRGKIFYSREELDRHMGKMNPLEDHQRKIIIEFCHLLEKSKQLFNGLRELPQYGHKQWHSYFGRTFDVYTKLWKFQQQHRGILDSKYGLKRWQIGEIASKIGQLYYHFYLRTSETAYLNEAFSFYSAIRGRSYYTQASKEDKCELMVKKLRYYARFIVVCLLLKKAKLVVELTKELEKQIVEYGNAYDPDDQVEWTVVVEEVRAFTSVEPVVEVLHPDSYPVILTHRLSPQTTPPIERSPQMNLSLQEVLIIGSNSTQVKFSELTMDMFRMMQTLEREPTGDIQHMYDESPRQRYISTPSAVNNKGYNVECGPSRGDNPHKYLLFKPSPSQIFVYLASGCNELPPNGTLLLYISADGLIIPPVKHPEDGGYDIGGLITTSKTDIGYRESLKEGKVIQTKHKELQVLYPGDLYPFTRRPMFLIVDSDNSYIFQNMPRHFGQPMVILMSPLDQPASIHAGEVDKRAHGSLFTLFLHCPLSAFCYTCELRQLSLVQWERAQSYIDTYLAEASAILIRSRIDMMYVAFLGDDFLRLLILRFIFCETVLRMHRAFRARTQLTRASPPLPDDLYEHPALTHIVIDLAAYLQLRGHFHDPSGVAPGPPPSKE